MAEKYKQEKKNTKLNYSTQQQISFSSSTFYKHWKIQFKNCLIFFTYIVHRNLILVVS